MSAPTGGWFVTRLPQYVEESAYGTFPTNPDMSWIGAIENWDPRNDIVPIEIRQLGSEDPAYLLKGTEACEVSLEYFMQNSTFAKYAVNSQGGGAGSIDRSLSLAAGIRMGGAAGTIYYYKMQGYRPRTITFTGRPGDATRCRVEGICQQIPTPTTSNPVGTGSWASDPGTAPWNFTDGGSSPVTVGGSGVPCTDISMVIERNLEQIYTLGSTQIQYLPPRSRGSTGTMTLVWLSTARYADLMAWTNRNVVWTLDDGVSTLTLSNCKFHRLDAFTVRATETTVERWAFMGTGATLT